MRFELSEEQALLRRSIREFAEAEVRPRVMEWANAQRFPTELLPKLSELGLMGIQFPEAYGGAGMSALDYCLCIEELDAAHADPANAHEMNVSSAPQHVQSPESVASAHRQPSDTIAAIAYGPLAMATLRRRSPLVSRQPPAAGRRAPRSGRR